ncbi:hypothetical protein [Marinobacter shengliensis]|uniref:Uncharacterized protein n=1 Tax=Marinobacter shengliensis TaxID=1389223 RepID=A0ABV4WBU1_9GAMM
MAYYDIFGAISEFPVGTESVDYTMTFSTGDEVTGSSWPLPDYSEIPIHINTNPEADLGGSENAWLTVKCKDISGVVIATKVVGPYTVNDIGSPESGGGV